VNKFVDDLIVRLGAVKEESDLKSLHDWVFKNKQRIPQTVRSINAELALSGDFELKPDLPNFTVGRSRSNLVILAANPGWDEVKNPIEQEYCDESAEQYWKFCREFFKLFPTEVGSNGWWTRAMKCADLLPTNESQEYCDESAEQYWKFCREFFKLFPTEVGSNGWWTRAMKFADLLPTNESVPSLYAATRVWWDWAHSSEQVGSWELIPFHSDKDGVTSKLREFPWLKQLAVASLKTVMRFKPRLLVVAGKGAYDLIRCDLLPAGWSTPDKVGEGPKAIHVSGRKLDGTSVIAVDRQIHQWRVRRRVVFAAMRRTLAAAT